MRLLEGNGTFGARSKSSDSIAPLSPDLPLTHTTHVLVPSLRRTAHLVVHVPPVMSDGLSVSDSEFRKRFKSSYDSLRSPTFLVRKRYKGMFEIILDTDSEGDELGEEEDEEVEESSDLDSKSKDAEDECPTVEDEDPVIKDEGHTARIKDLTAMSVPLGLGYRALRHRESPGLGELSLALFERYDRDIEELFTWLEAREQKEMRGRVTALEQERDRKER
nr:hypothetical protein [Tanacetum cinerariifolium]